MVLMVVCSGVCEWWIKLSDGKVAVEHMLVQHVVKQPVTVLMVLVDHNRN